MRQANCWADRRKKFQVQQAKAPCGILFPQGTLVAVEVQEVQIRRSIPRSAVSEGFYALR
jgi:hypothetical protein